jgi:hypothetical protein
MKNPENRDWCLQPVSEVQLTGGARFARRKISTEGATQAARGIRALTVSALYRPNIPNISQRKMI